MILDDTDSLRSRVLKTKVAEKLSNKRISTNESNARNSSKESVKNMENDQNVTGNLSKYFRIEPCRFDQLIYTNASILLKKFKVDNAKQLNRIQGENVAVPASTSVLLSDNPLEEIESGTTSVPIEKEKEKKNAAASKNTLKVKYKTLKEKKLTYELALSTLKFASILEKILEECAFFLQFPDYKEEDQLVLIIFNDYVKRKFQKRNITSAELENSIAIANQIENIIYEMRTKLNAAVMRTRVKHSVRSLNQLLPEHYRVGEEFAEHMLVYMWYNANLITNDELVKALNERSFKRVSAAKALETNEFYQDRHCADLYVFHHDDRDFLEESEMVAKKKISVIQDKSTCLAINCFIANIVQGEEIALITPTTLLTAVHIEGLLKNKFGTVLPIAPIRVFRTPKEDDDPKLLHKMGSSAIKVHTEDVAGMDCTNEKYKLIRHVLFQAKCTRSSIVSPVDFLDTEQDDISLLKDYAMRATLDGNKPPKISDSIVRNSMVLRQCFRFSSVRSVTYLSHSIYEEENEILIHKTVDLINKTLMKDTMEPNGKYETFSNLPPNLPMLIDDLTESGILLEKNIRYPPSAETNGFFIALFSKEYRYCVGDDIEAVTLDDKPKKKKKKQAQPD